MPSRAPARRRLAGALFALLAVIGALCWPLTAAEDLSPADHAEHEAATKLLDRLGDGIPVRPRGPTDRELGKLREKLDKKVKLTFEKVSTLDAIHKLLRQADVPFVVDGPALLQGDGEITIEGQEVSIRQALNIACDAFSLEKGDWTVVDGTIVFSTAKEIAKRTIVNRSYDIRHLLIQAPNFTNAPSLDLNDSLSNTSSGGSSGGAAAASSNIFFEDDSGGYLPTREEMIEQIVTLIQDTVGEQAEWAAYGGEVGSLRELNGKIIIRASARNHEHIEAILDGLDKGNAEMVHIEARCLIVKTAMLDKIRAANNGELIFDAKTAGDVIKQLTEDAGTKRVALVRNMLRNGQRSHVSTTLDKTFLSDVEPSAGTGSVDPTLSLARTGMVIDTEVTAGSGARTVTMTLRAQIATPNITGRELIPVGPGYDLDESPTPPAPDATGAAKPQAVAPDFTKGPTKGTPEVNPAPAAAPAEIAPQPGVAPRPDAKNAAEPAAVSRPRDVPIGPRIPKRLLTPIPAGAPASGPADNPPAAPHGAKPTVNPLTKVLLPPITGSAALATPSNNLTRFMTTINMPNNGAAIFSGSTREQPGIAEDTEMILIIRAKAGNHPAEKAKK